MDKDIEKANKILYIINISKGMKAESFVNVIWFSVGLWYTYYIIDSGAVVFLQLP